MQTSSALQANHTRLFHCPKVKRQQLFQDFPIFRHSMKMVLDEAYADLCEGSKTANCPGMENSSKMTVATSLSDAPAATSSSEVRDRLPSLNVSDSESATKKSTHPESAQDNERIDAERVATEDIHLLIAHMQWKELCTRFFFPILLFGFVVLGLQFITSFGMTSAGQTWYRYSVLLFIMIFCTGIVTEVAYEEFGFI